MFYSTSNVYSKGMPYTNKCWNKWTMKLNSIDNFKWWIDKIILDINEWWIDNIILGTNDKLINLGIPNANSNSNK